MKLKVNYEIEGNKYYDITEMRTPSVNSKSYFDFYVSFKRHDEIKDYYISIIDGDKIIHREHVKISWITNPKDTGWIYGITLCGGGRVFSEVKFGNKLPTCTKDRKSYYIDVQSYDEEGRPLFDKKGCPVTHKEYCRKEAVKEVSTDTLPKSILKKLDMLKV